MLLVCRRLASPLPLVLLALALLAPSAHADSCTTAFGGVERPTDAPLGACAAAHFVATPNPLDPGAADRTVTFDGSDSSGPDGTSAGIAHFVWDFGDGATASTTGSTTTHVYAATRDRYHATLQLLDASDDPIADSPTVDVVVDVLPTVSLDGPSGVLRPGAAYEFTATGGSAGGTIDHYAWNWGDGTTSQTATGSAQHTFSADDASTGVSVTAVDDLALESAPATHAIVVHDQKPVVQLVATPASVAIGEHLTLSAAGSSDPDGTIVEYRWDLNGDGVYERSSGTAPSASAGGFPNPGTIVLGVKAIDDSGAFTVRRIGITVTGSGGAIGGGDDGGTGTGGGSGGGSGGGGAGAGNGGSGFAVGLTGNVIQRLGAALSKGVGLRASANRAAKGTLTLTVSARDAKALRLPGRHGRKPVAIGTLKVTLRAGRSAKAAVKLKRAAAKALRHAHPRTLRITITGALRAGAVKASAARVVLLRG